MHGLRHILTPGTPTYAALKLSAVGGVVGLQYLYRRRAARDHEAAAAERAASRGEARRSPHPRSKKKRSRRRR